MYDAAVRSNDCEMATNFQWQNEMLGLKTWDVIRRLSAANWAFRTERRQRNCVRIAAEEPSESIRECGGICKARAANSGISDKERYEHLSS